MSNKQTNSIPYLFKILNKKMEKTLFTPINY